MLSEIEPLRLGDLEVKLPLIQGGMGVKVSTSSLAIAVANCGAAGTIAGVGLGFGTAMNDEDYYRASREALSREVQHARQNTKGVVGVNVMVALANYNELVRTASAERADFIASGAGLPLKLPELVESKAIKLLPIVSSAKAAAIIIKAWKKRYNRLPDGLIVEGPLAGGHLGFKPDELKDIKEGALESIVVDVIKLTQDYLGPGGVAIPVIAAGGIFDGKDMVRFLRLGAKAVQMATRFVATHECSVPDSFKQAYLNARREDAIIIQSPVGMPGRALKNAFMEKAMKGERIPPECNYQCLKNCDGKTVAYCIAGALFKAADGDVDDAVIFCGSNVWRIDKIVSVKELIDEIIEGAKQELAKA